MSQLVNAEVNSGNRIKSGTRIKLRFKDRFVDAIPHCENALWWLRSRLFQAAYMNSLGFLCGKLLRFLGYKLCTVSQNLPPFRGPRIEALKYKNTYIAEKSCFM